MPTDALELKKGGVLYWIPTPVMLADRTHRATVPGILLEAKKFERHGSREEEGEHKREVRSLS